MVRLGGETNPEPCLLRVRLQLRNSSTCRWLLFIGLSLAAAACRPSTTVVDQTTYAEFNGQRYFAGNPSGLRIEERYLSRVGQPTSLNFGRVDSGSVYALEAVDPKAILVMEAIGPPWESPYVLLFREGVFERPPGGATSSNALKVPAELRGLCRYAAPSPSPGEPTLDGCSWSIQSRAMPRRVT
jgi:hypothetical protein